MVSLSDCLNTVYGYVASKSWFKTGLNILKMAKTHQKKKLKKLSTVNKENYKTVEKKNSKSDTYY